MTRARLNRLALIPALLVTVAILAFVIYPRLSPTAQDAALCPRTETAQGPSGRTLTLCDTLVEIQPSGEPWAVIRVTDPDLPVNPALPDRADHDWACNTWGLPALDTAPRPVRIIVQIMARPFPRGEPAPGITQSIEAYSVPGNACEWEFL